ncbi:MAG: methylenetetrahydrofolate reductase [NAD(P)H] [Burkholderiales bacterium]|nr:MAG: methylenetetrahydrofolate reductase [NAD(P)H] [Burkholderiales bacterium]
MIPISFEFFPPNTEAGSEKLRAVRAQLWSQSPEYFSVTYGAGGATRDKTVATVFEIADEGLPVAPHLSCVGAHRAQVAQLLERYRERGIQRLVALRGDLPSGMVDHGDFRYASELVAFIREHSGDWFRIDVAGYPEVHPQARSAGHDLQAFANKMRAGANGAITQFFYNADAYFAFVDEARRLGIDAPIVPGIMPIHNFSKVARFAEACGAEMPRWIAQRMRGFGDDAASVRAFGLDVVAGLCQRLVDGGAPALHFYTLNQAGLTLEVLGTLRRAPA